jgi:hypothetical protein
LTRSIGSQVLIKNDDDKSNQFTGPKGFMVDYYATTTRPPMILKNWQIDMFAFENSQSSWNHLESICKVSAAGVRSGCPNGKHRTYHYTMSMSSANLIRIIYTNICEPPNPHHIFEKKELV